MTTYLTAPAPRAARNAANAGSTPEGPGAATEREDTITTSRTRRRLGPLGRLAAVGAVALVLAGAVASPADAATRSSAVRAANTGVGWCFESGGDPYVYEGGGSIAVACEFDGGGFWAADYSYDTP